MKKLSLLMLFIAGSMLVFQSCKVEKRVHRPGYHVEWKKSSPKKQHNPQLANREKQVTPAERIEWQEDPLVDDRSVVASANEDLLHELTQHIAALVAAENPYHDIASNSGADASSSKEIQELCETIVMTDGRTIMGHVIEITPEIIQYKKCNYAQGPTITLNRKDVDKIIYANGAEDIISGYSAGGTPKAPSEAREPQNKKLEVLGLLSMIFAIIGLVFAGIILGLAAIILAAISFGKFAAQPDRFVGRGFAIAGLIIGAAAIIGALIFIANMA